MRRTVRICLALLAAGTLGALLASACSAQRERNPYLVRTFEEDGHLVDEIIVPGRPPAVAMQPQAVQPPVPAPSAGTNSLEEAPAFTWCYGCSATSAAMLAGWYDRHYYTNMYAGPANGGVCPLDNETAWPDPLGSSDGYCPLSATKNGVDGRSIRGHVDDYWVAYLSSGNDPFVVNGWPEHAQGDCTGDYMGTNQDYWNNVDGSTTFYNYPDGTPLYDYTGAEGNPAPSRRRDGGHGLRLFVESRGYTLPTVTTPYQGSQKDCFNQYIYGYGGNTNGFTYDQFKTEIDNGHPVLIHLEGHTMLGFGYDDPSTIYICDTWNTSYHSMTWGSPYGGYAHMGVTCLHVDAPPLPVTLVGLRAEGTRGRVCVTWETANEVGTTGFIVVRSERPEGPFEPVNGPMVAAEGQPGQVMRYEFLDQTALPGRIYHYRIREVFASGTINEIEETTKAVAGGAGLHDLVPAQIRAPLPL